MISDRQTDGKEGMGVGENGKRKRKTRQDSTLTMCQRVYWVFCYNTTVDGIITSNSNMGKLRCSKTQGLPM